MAQGQTSLSLDSKALKRLKRLGEQLYPGVNERFTKKPVVQDALKVYELVLARNNGQLPQDMREAMGEE